VLKEIRDRLRECEPQLVTYENEQIAIVRKDKRFRIVLAVAVGVLMCGLGVLFGRLLR
jgi:fluoride ion exporter CrcB/FEX